MPQVPYNPVPSQTLAGTPTPQMNPASPLDAFGGSIAESLKGLGRVSEKVGDELFTRAIALQQQQNQAHADEMATNYMLESGELRNKFNSLEGKAAQDALPQYIEDLKGVRRTIRNEVGNPEVQRLYDSETRRVMTQNAIAGSTYAASEQKKYFSAAGVAKTQAIKDQALQDPMNEGLFRDGIESIKQEALQQARLHNWSQEVYEQYQAKNISDMWANRITGLARTEPIAAKKMFDDAMGRGEIRGEQVGKVNTVVQQGLWNQGSRNISAQVRSGSDGYWGSQKVSADAARKAIGATEGSGSYTAPHPEFFDKRRGEMVHAIGKYGIMSYNLAPWLEEAGMPNMSEADFLRSPKAQDQLFDFKFGQYMEKGGSFNEAAAMWLTGTTVANARAKGLKDPLGTDVDEYLRRANGHLASGVPLKDKVARGKVLANEASPNDPMMEDYVVNRVEGDYSRDRRVQIEADYNNTATITRALNGGGEGGKIPTTVDELTATSPETEAAWRALPDTKQRQVLEILKRNAKGDVVETPERFQTFTSLRSMATDKEGDAQKKFMDTNIMALDLPFNRKNELLKLQDSVRKGAQGDPRVNYAISQLRGFMTQDLGLRPSTPEWNAFRGMVQNGIEDFAAREGRPPKLKEIQEIGHRSAQEVVGSGWFSNYRLYELPISDDTRAKVSSYLRLSRPERAPSEAEIMQEYRRRLYQVAVQKSIQGSVQKSLGEGGK